MFPVDGQLGPFKLEDTLRVVNLQSQEQGGMVSLKRQGSLSETSWSSRSCWKPHRSYQRTSALPGPSKELHDDPAGSRAMKMFQLVAFRHSRKECVPWRSCYSTHALY
jgi:hypothetical protein